MRRSVLNPLLLPLLLALVFPAGAEVESLANWYQVEVIVFAQEDIFGDEGYPRNPALEYPPRMKFLGNDDRMFPELPPNATFTERLAALMVPDRFLTRERARRREGFVPLEKNRRNLNPDAHTLDRSGDYRVLFHSAWQQEATGSGSAPWIHVDGGRQFNGHRELEGSIRLYRSRFLHLQLNLWLSRPGAVMAGGDRTGAGNDGPEPVTLPEPPRPEPSKALQRLRMMQPTSDAPLRGAEAETDRFPVARVDLLKRSEQISVNSPTYIDHPRMGVLVLVTPLEGDEEGKE